METENTILSDMTYWKIKYYWKLQKVNEEVAKLYENFLPLFKEENATN